MVIDARDDVSAQLQLADPSRREVNPSGVQLGKSDRLVAGLAQALQQPLLLDVSERHRPIVASSEIGDDRTFATRRRQPAMLDVTVL